MNQSSPADPKLAHKALELLRALCKGNGIKQDSVRLGQFNGQVLSFDAITRLQVRPVVEKKSVSGRQGGGEVLQSEQDVQGAIDNMMRSFEHDNSVKGVVIQTILSRKDKGFFMQKEDIPIDALQRNFSYTEACPTCHGQGKGSCPRCHGNGREVCNKCHAKGTIPCINCHGSGQMMGPNGTQIQCNRCFGRRVMQCDICRATGQIPCRQCRATGQAQCPACKGTGGQTQMTQVKMIATTNFHYERNDVPPEVVLLLEEKGAALTTSGHMKLSAQKADSREEPLAIDYHVSYPFGDISFTIRDKPVRGKLFGFKGKVLGLPPFLDQLIAPGLAELQKAASGKGSASNHVRKASKYRVIGFALLTAARQSVRKSTETLKQKYPVGLSIESINRIVPMAKKAIANITRKQRYVGIAAGLLLSSILYAGYFIGPGRGAVTGLIANTNLHIVMDLVMMALGVFVTAIVIKQTAGHAMRRALGHLVPPKKRGWLTPKSQPGDWAAYAVSAVLFLVIVELTVHTGAAVPAWYAGFRLG